MQDDLVALKAQVKEIQAKDTAHKENHEKLEKKLDGIQKDIHAIRVALVGDPNQDHPSILMRLDRLEQSEKLRSKVVWIIGSCVIGLFLERLREIM